MNDTLPRIFFNEVVTRDGFRIEPRCCAMTAFKQKARELGAGADHLGPQQFAAAVKCSLSPA